jgi:hypothetical protein
MVSVQSDSVHHKGRWKLTAKEHLLVLRRRGAQHIPLDGGRVAPTAFRALRAEHDLQCVARGEGAEDATGRIHDRPLVEQVQA